MVSVLKAILEATPKSALIRLCRQKGLDVTGKTKLQLIHLLQRKRTTALSSKKKKPTKKKKSMKGKKHKKSSTTPKKKKKTSTKGGKKKSSQKKKKSSSKKKKSTKKGTRRLPRSAYLTKDQLANYVFAHSPAGTSIDALDEYKKYSTDKLRREARKVDKLGAFSPEYKDVLRHPKNKEAITEEVDRINALRKEAGKSRLRSKAKGESLRQYQLYLTRQRAEYPRGGEVPYSDDDDEETPSAPDAASPEVEPPVGVGAQQRAQQNRDAYDLRSGASYHNRYRRMY